MELDKDVKFVKGVGFKWKQQSPNVFEFTSTLDSYCINDDKQELAALPYFSQIQSMINDMLNGNMDKFLMVFNADYTEISKSKSWLLTATPKISAVSDFLESVTMTGDIKNLKQIIITYKNSMTITIEFKRMKTDSPDEIKC